MIAKTCLGLQAVLYSFTLGKGLLIEPQIEGSTAGICLILVLINLVGCFGDRKGV